MIPQAALNAWSQQAPWPSPVDVEHDLILSRLIVDIANHPLLGGALAFRGGTSLQKLHLPRAVRFSNDLDYVRTGRGPARDLMGAVRDVAVRVGLVEARYASKTDTITMHFDAEPTGVVGRIRVKIEINIREVEPAFDHVRIPHRVDTPWFAGAADVLTFELEELLGTKLRALHQRRKGRDLFDLWLGLSHMDADPDRVMAAYQHYLDASGVRIRPGDFLATLDEKLHRRQRDDTLELVTAAEQAGNTRLADNHRQVAENLDRVITSLQALDPQEPLDAS